MSSNYTFNHMPTVGISRSRFARTSQHKTSFNLGKIVPIYVDEVLPGDTRSLDMAALVRMSTPIAPIMDNIHLDFFAFFVPNRLVWDHWKDFMGENRESAGIPSREYSVPSIPIGTGNAALSSVDDNLATYFGLPSEELNVYKRQDLFVSALPFRAYYLIYNEWFRNQNIIAPVAVYTGDNNYVKVSSFNFADLTLLSASKLPDYFTKGLPYAQKGDAIKIPMGNFAPLKAGTPYDISYTGTSGYFGDSATSDDPGDIVLSGLERTNLGVDVSAIAGTIDQLRYAFQLQKLLWKDAAYGSRYWELLASHFGVTAPDASLQRPEYLGGKRMEINVDQVLSTSGYSNTDSTTVGATGANSCSAFKGSIFTKSFTEHGWLFIMAVARHDQTYGQGINRMYSRQNRFDYYWPVFANLGSQDIKVKEIFVNADPNVTYDPDKVFAYQESWAEYRFKPSIVSARLNPSLLNSLSFWTLANDFATEPSLSQQFIEQGRENLSRALVTGNTGPDFIADFYFRDIAVRPMPTFSLPGFADHH